ncbi:hypothetical protein BJX70DRAFT_386392 [Aspergillus crustosus]
MSWYRTKRQVGFVGHITSIMDTEQCRLMDELLNELFRSLSVAVSNLENVIQQTLSTRPSFLRLRFKTKAAWVWKKEALDGVISDLEGWQRRFDPSWFLLMKIANPLVDKELAKARAAEPKDQEPATVAKSPLALAAGVRAVLSPTPEQIKSILLPPVAMEWMTIPFANTKAGRRPGNSRWYIVDTIQVGQAARVRDVEREVRVLAAKLAQADPLAFGLLNCKGAAPSGDQVTYPRLGQQVPGLAPPPVSPRARSPSPSPRDCTHFQIILRIPQGMEKLQSLRSLLLNSDAHISLSRKVHMARELSKAVHYVHTLAFVHKNIRPESVLCFEDPDGITSRCHAFLVGFDAFRAVDAGTLMGGDMSWARNVYLHPTRQGINPSQKYNMQHDIYSLGVCLLEIGLWESFVEYDDDNGTNGSPQTKFGESYSNFQAWCRTQDSVVPFVVLAELLKVYLVGQAKTRLAPRMGDRYAEVVVSCLTCLDDGNDDFGGEETARESIVGMQFVEHIMKNLDKISV